MAAREGLSSTKASPQQRRASGADSVQFQEIFRNKHLTRTVLHAPSAPTRVYSGLSFDSSRRQRAKARLQATPSGKVTFCGPVTNPNKRTCVADRQEHHPHPDSRSSDCNSRSNSKSAPKDSCVAVTTPSRNTENNGAKFKRQTD